MYIRDNAVPSSSKPGLHISFSQAWLYLNCSLKYYFRYVQGAPPEKASIAPMFGTAIHRAVERYYRDILLGKNPAGLEALKVIFSESLQSEVASSKVPISYKKDLPDEKRAIEMGNRILDVAYPDLQPSSDTVVAGVEVPLSAQLTDVQGNPVDMALKGFIDLVLLKGDVNPVVVDFKTAKQAKSQDAADKDLQMSVYAYLLAGNDYADSSYPVTCQFGVFRKLKTPKFETVITVRDQTHTDRLLKLLNAVLAGIENRVFIPNHSWLCIDCEFANACRAW